MDNLSRLEIERPQRTPFGQFNLGLNNRKNGVDGLAMGFVDPEAPPDVLEVTDGCPGHKLGPTGVSLGHQQAAFLVVHLTLPGGQQQGLGSSVGTLQRLPWCLKMFPACTTTIKMHQAV